MKRYIKTAVLAFSCMGFLVSLSSCSDMLEPDSTRQAIEPSMNEKTDSVFYAFGIVQAMQQLADQYVFQGEMRGDLVKTTAYTDNNLRQLANFSATTANKYDSAYVYYRVINNCNYYLQHRDTTLMTGGTNVTLPEYAAVKAFRAWAYLQLVRNYGEVPFITEPLTQISQIDNNNYPTLGLDAIVNELTADLLPFSGYKTPTFGGYSFTRPTNFPQSNGNTQNKTFYGSLLAIPIDVMLGELYLEAGQYDRAAQHYITYLTQVTDVTSSGLISSYSMRSMNDELPSDFSFIVNGGASWSAVFGFGSSNLTQEVITYIPMAVTRLEGPTTEIPSAFGFDFYKKTSNLDDNYVEEIQVEASDSYRTLSDSCDYYYLSSLSTNEPIINKARLGDMRFNSVTRTEQQDDVEKVWITKYNSGNIILFRRATVLLHLAEALNRLNMPDAAFAVLKDGINPELVMNADYISDETRQLLQTTYPLLSTENRQKFDSDENYVGIHQHGSGLVGDYLFSNPSDRNLSYSYQPGKSPYTYAAVVGKKLAEIQKTFNVQVGTSRQDSINAVEDLLCDEYALELAFEGTRWPDLQRLARHKNDSGLYGSDFGSRWLASKLAYKQPVVNLEDKNNWYLPFK